MRAAQNPFRTDCVTQLPFQLQNAVWNELWARLEQQNGCGAIVGHCGSGKTTLLGAIETKLQQRGLQVIRLNFNQQNRKLASGFRVHDYGAGHALLVDGVEQLSRYDTWRLSRAQPQIFIVTSHQPSFLPLWFQTTTSPHLLANLCEQLGATLDETQAKTLWQATGGDLREAFWQLYDQSAREKSG